MAVARSWRTRLAVAIIGSLLLSSCGVFKVVKKGETSVGDFQNLDFEEGEAGGTPDGWILESSSFDDDDNYDLSLDPDVKRSGNLSLRLRHPGVDDQDQLPAERHDDRASIQYCRDVPFENRLARVSAFVKVEGSRAFASLFVHNPRPSTIQGGESSLTGEWAQYAVSQPMPWTGHMCIQLGLTGVGTLWVDDISIEEFDPGEGEVISVPNLDMEETAPSGAPKGWSLSQRLLPLEEGQQGLAELRADPEVKHSGSFSARLNPPPESAGARASITATTCTDPSPFLGRWVRVSGWLRREAVGRFFTSVVDFHALPVTRARMVEVLRSNEPSQLAEISRLASVFGLWEAPHEEWARGQIVAFVPEHAREVCISFSSSEGAVWADDLSLEILDF